MWDEVLESVATTGLNTFLAVLYVEIDDYVDSALALIKRHADARLTYYPAGETAPRTRSCSATGRRWCSRTPAVGRARAADPRPGSRTSALRR